LRSRTPTPHQRHIDHLPIRRELLCAIEENREPENSAADNLTSVALCLTALQLADQRRVVAL